MNRLSEKREGEIRERKEKKDSSSPVFEKRKARTLQEREKREKESELYALPF